MDSEDRFKAFEARLSALKHKMESGLVERAASLRAMADRLETGDEQARRQIKTESHKLRGVAGTYGHQQLTDLAAELEQRASMSPPATVGRMARELAELAETTGKRSEPPAARVPNAQPPPRATQATQQPERAGMSARERTVSERPRVTTGEGKALRVLAMDDDPITQRLLKLTLREVGGFDAEIVDNARTALQLIEERTFDVVVSDAMMPDMNGREFSEAARAAGATMPIIILSAASPEELGWLKEVPGSTAWLRKPFKPSELVHDIARIVEAERTQ
jgi:CheY-like chemotaxis protein/HPt (histidine-containing phosphotransfer) domain-containing protein